MKKLDRKFPEEYKEIICEKLYDFVKNHDNKTHTLARVSFCKINDYIIPYKMKA